MAAKSRGYQGLAQDRNSTVKVQASATHVEVEGDWGTMSVIQPVSGDIWDTISPEVEEQTDAVSPDHEDKELSGWPTRNSVTVGPFCINEAVKHNVLSLPPHSQSQSPLFKLLGILAEDLVDILFEHHSTIWKLAFTCQKAHAIVRSVLEVWDMTTLYFNGCEEEPTQEQKEVNAAITSKNKSKKSLQKRYVTADQRQKEADIARRGTVRSNLVVAFLRGEARERMDESLYESQLWATFQLCRTVQWRGDYFKRIHLHRIPFLTVDLLQILVPQMTNLEMLGIYRCPLIHIGDAMRLLEIIRVDRMKGRENQVSLDFYPRLHIGPVMQVGNPRTVGGFGATWENWEGESDKAIYAIVFRFAVQSRLQGFDVLATHCQFRKWLEDGACWDVANTLDAMAQAFNFDRISPLRKTKDFEVAASPTTHLDGHTIEENEYSALYPDLTKAILLMDQRNPYHEGNINRFFTSNLYRRPEGCEWMFQPFECTTCRTVMPGVFFRFHKIKEAEEMGGCDRPCLGCMLTEYLHTERDHFKVNKCNIIYQWILDGRTEDGVLIKNENDLGRLIDDFERRQVMEHAINLDRKRAEFVKRFGYDKELQELQKPVTDQVMRSRRGGFLSAPMIGEWAVQKERLAKVKANPELGTYLLGKATSFMDGHRHYG